MARLLPDKQCDMRVLRLAAAFLCVIGVSLCIDVTPEQIHLSYGDDIDSMIVSWVTSDKTATSVVRFGQQGKLDQTATGTSERFVEPMNATIAQECSIKTPLKCPQSLVCPNCVTEYLHSCILKPLTSGAMYEYRIDGSGAQYTFKAKNTSSDWAGFNVAIYGDMGAPLTEPSGAEAPSVGLLTAEIERGSIDAVMHVGDFAYDLWEQGGRVADSFMRQIEPIAARVPYLVTPGNHEGGTNQFGNLHHYVKRFNMPMKRRSSNNYFSWDMGPVHFVSFSSEAWFWQLWESEKQFAWLKQDLAAVDRSRTPFVVTMSHRPMYCSNSDDTDDCTKDDSVMRLGLPVFGTRFFKLEALFREYNVDLAFWAHEHSYERLWPTYDGKVFNGTTHPGEPYRNPLAPVHVITGAAGCREGHGHYDKGPRGPWSAVRNSEWGYGRLIVANKTHVGWEQVEDINGTVVDSFWLVKDPEHATHMATVTRSNIEQLQQKEHDLQAQIFAGTEQCMDKFQRLPGCANV